MSTASADELCARDTQCTEEPRQLLRQLQVHKEGRATSRFGAELLKHPGIGINRSPGGWFQESQPNGCRVCIFRQRQSPRERSSHELLNSEPEMGKWRELYVEVSVQDIGEELMILAPGVFSVDLVDTSGLPVLEPVDVAKTVIWGMIPSCIPVSRDRTRCPPMGDGAGPNEPQVVVDSKLLRLMDTQNDGNHLVQVLACRQPVLLWPR